MPQLHFVGVYTPSCHHYYLVYNFITVGSTLGREKCSKGIFINGGWNAFTRLKVIVANLGPILAEVFVHKCDESHLLISHHRTISWRQTAFVNYFKH